MRSNDLYGSRIWRGGLLTGRSPRGSNVRFSWDTRTNTG